jgi:DNA-binding HxlR family transcriptional regulator
MRQTSFADFHCSLARAMEAAGDWWSPLILRDVFAGLTRFEDLVEDLGISRNLLTSRLRSLVDHGVLQTRPYGPHPNRVDYLLTDAGSELVVILMALTAWGDSWQTPRGGPPITFHHHGHRCLPAVTCADCGQRVDAQEITLHAGPGGRSAPGTRLIGRRLRAAARSSD